MPAERVSMRQAREIIRLKFSASLPTREIARRLGLAPSTVRETLSRLDSAGLSWPLPEGIGDAELEAALYANRRSKRGHRRHVEPDWPAVHRELKRKHVTLLIVWDEYIAANPGGYSYSRFCELYRGFEAKLSPTMRQTHAAGERLFVDYAGDGVPVVVDRLTGEIRMAQIFVAVLGASSFTFAHASWTQALPDWIDAHVRALEAIGGVPQLLVPDNTKTAVIKACLYDPQVNRTYAEMAAHYEAAIAAKGRREVDSRTQGAAGYVIVKGATPEFDYPKGTDNVYANYDGADGIPIGGTAWRSLFAWNLDDVNILLSGYITDESKILLHRNIRDRVETIAPFLQLDRDPYVVISEGRLYWIQDAYATSAWFPYAKPEPAGGDINYIRNSVKIVIDAYNGTLTFYVTDVADPIVATYRRIFPSLFKPFDTMPLDLQKHIRYPEDLFNIQALQYRAYHMGSPEVFYNREDLWQFPREPVAPEGMDAGGMDANGGTRMAPYYIMMRLPGESVTEFFLMLPMAPSQRENMIAWLAARCDLPDYGKLIVYEFPKEKLVYGPFQIEALINQNTQISQQISLWNQMGSRVIRGILLVVPIENSILYVSPLYLRAQSGQLPELKRVIAAYGDRVVMEETLPAALAALFKESAPVAALAPPAGLSAAGPADERAREALVHYDRAIDRLKAGDWAGFGAELDALRPLLEELGRQPATR